jgi:hypothetical protein
MSDVQKIWNVSENVLWPHDPMLVPHRLAITRRALDQLQQAGVPLRIEPIDVQAMVDRSYAAYDARRNLSLPGYGGKLGIFGDWFNKGQQFDAIMTYLDELVQASNGRASIVKPGKSIQGQDIKAIRISSAATPGRRASIIVTGTHHAREWISPMVVMGFADALIRQYDKDPNVKKVVDNVDTYIVPVLNPDGYASTFSGTRLQRKNMHPDCNVDLNRNYDATGWGMGVSTDCSGETYPGTSAFSEPETQAIKALAELATNLHWYIDYHSPADAVMIPYAYTQTPPPNYDKNKQWADLYSSTLQGVNGNSEPAQDGYQIGMGSGGGGLDWFREKYTESLCVELRQGNDPMDSGGNEFSIPDNGDPLPSVEENWVAWLAVADTVATENPDPGGGSSSSGSGSSGSSSGGSGSTSSGSGSTGSGSGSTGSGSGSTGSGSGSTGSGSGSTGSGSGSTSSGGSAGSSGGASGSSGSNGSSSGAGSSGASSGTASSSGIGGSDAGSAGGSQGNPSGTPSPTGVSAGSGCRLGPSVSSSHDEIAVGLLGLVLGAAGVRRSRRRAPGRSRASR